MPKFSHDGLALSYVDAGDGLPFVFQHGMGGDAGQPVGLFTPPTGVRLLVLESRGHGATPVGPPERLMFDVLADDVIALLDHLGVQRAVVGGISMGSGVALNLAVRHPSRVRALVLSRPAWLAGPQSARHLALYGEIARLLRSHGAEKGRAMFAASPELSAMEAESPDSAASLLSQFTRPQAVDAVAVLERIPGDAPTTDAAAWRQIAVPTLVLANRQDPIHPHAYGETYAAEIPGAAFAELTPKSIDRAAHAVDVQRHLEAFLANAGAS